jgi:hypothetical protein
MTQLVRYIEHLKLEIHGIRLVQFSPNVLSGAPTMGSWTGAADPVETHLFLNGREGEETYERLLAIAARTCYLHATLTSALEPELVVEHSR